MTRNNRFIRGHGVFTCISCERKTRGSEDSASLDMCHECYELSGSDNYHNDEGVSPTADEMKTYNGWLKTIEKRGGNVERVKSLNDYIWGGDA